MKSYIQPLLEPYLFPGEGMAQQGISFTCGVYEYEREVFSASSKTRKFESQNNQESHLKFN